MVKNLPANAGDIRDMGSIPGWGRFPGVGCHSLLQGIFPTHGIEPGSPAFLVDSLPSEPAGKPVNTYQDYNVLEKPMYLNECIHGWCRLDYLMVCRGLRVL